MRTNVAETSIASYNGAVQETKSEQHKLILRVMRKGRKYTGQMLCHMTGMPPNVISARMFELREKLKKVDRPGKMVCPHSGMQVFAHVKVA